MVGEIGNMTRVIGISLALALSGSVAGAAEYYVATDGSDANSGTIELPLRSIQRAASLLKPGDACYVRGGVYRETVRLARSGEQNEPVRFAAYPGEAVVLSGAEAVRAEWSPCKDGIWQARVDLDVSQLFVDGEMMVEARWPNQPFDRRWDKATWAADQGGEYGRIVDPALAETGIDWTGALAALNVGSWTTHLRVVRNHSPGGDAFQYDRDMGRRLEADRPHPPGFNRYFLWGKLEALDAPGEWFFDRRSKTIYLWTPRGQRPDRCRIEGKVRDYAFLVHDVHDVTISDFSFFAATLLLEECDRCLVEDCRFSYPTYAGPAERAGGGPIYIPRRCREAAHEYLGGQRVLAPTLIEGGGNVVRNCRIEYSEAPGLMLAGRDNLVENCLIHDVDWRGLGNGVVGNCAGVHMAPSAASTFRRNTVYNVGSSEGIVLPTSGPSLCELNYVHHGGLVQSDGGLIQCNGVNLNGTVIRYNWVHDHDAFNWGGIGIRGDDLTRNLILHHNVAWNCANKGFMVKGDRNQVYCNTAVNNPQLDMVLWAAPEPFKQWAPRQWDHLLKQQNADSRAYNNYAPVLTGQMQHEVRRAKSIQLPPGDLAANYHPLSPCEMASKEIELPEDEPVLRDPQRFDFRPRPGSPLIDAGRAISGITEGFLGDAPDVGAYEHGAADYWIPGCQAPCASMPVPPNGAGSVKADADLMWLAGCRAASHQVYLGSNRDRVADADADATEFQGALENNVFPPPGLQAGQSYFWRVDVQEHDGVTVKGEVWEFRVSDD